MNKKELHWCIGWLGVAFGLLVAPMQLIKIVQTGEVGDISLFTYLFLCLAMVCYLVEAIRIKSPVFITAQAVNLVVNSAVLVLLVILS
jgi:uncharacterized protein with PQ loop repeat